MPTLLKQGIWKKEKSREWQDALLLLSLFFGIIIFNGCGGTGGSGAADPNRSAAGHLSGHAEKGGTQSIPDGATVELFRIDDSGSTLQLFATATLEGGRYSFNLSSLRLDYASDLVVRVVEPSNGAQMRAFVVGERVDISAASEAGVRLVLEKISGKKGSALSDFTLKELADLGAALHLLAMAKSHIGPIEVEEAVMEVQRDYLADPVTALFLESTSENGQTSEGPGDAGHFFPFEPGTLWRYAGKRSSPSGLIPYRSSTAVAGSTTTNGNAGHRFLSAGSDRGGYEEEFRQKNSHGITFEGASYFIDPSIIPVLPFQEIKFPLREGDSFIQFEENNVDLGDLDQDGIHERATLRSVVTVERFEDVSVQAGFFFNAAKIVTDATLQFQLSKASPIGRHLKVTSQITESDWFAPGVGLIRSTITSTFTSGSETTTETDQE